MEKINASNLKRADKPWEGKKIRLKDGESIEIDNVLVDNIGEPKFYHVKTGWFGTEFRGKEVLLPSDLISEKEDEFSANMDKDSVERFPEWDDDEPITQELIDNVINMENEIIKEQPESMHPEMAHKMSKSKSSSKEQSTKKSKK
ncbi:MAG: hypothetical protein QXT63_04295 [Thermoplasmata archaeon]